MCSEEVTYSPCAAPLAQKPWTWTRGCDPLLLCLDFISSRGFCLESFIVSTPPPISHVGPLQTPTLLHLSETVYLLTFNPKTGFVILIQSLISTLNTLAFSVNC